MRNLKKVLSLALAMVMLLGMMVVGAGAVETNFKDDGSITEANKEAVAVMNALGILKGDKDGFRPKDPVTRGEAAKILVYVADGPAIAEGVKAKTTTDFADVNALNHWASGYINYCAGMEYISGHAGNFEPEGNVTAAEFGKMMLNAMGSEEKYTGSGWNTRVARDATKAELTENVNITDWNKALTREQASQMAFNALTGDLEGSTGYKLRDTTEAETDALTYPSLNDAVLAKLSKGTPGNWVIESANSKTSLGYVNYTLDWDGDVDGFKRTTKKWTAANDVEVVVEGADATVTYTAGGVTADQVKKDTGVSDTVAANKVYVNGVAQTGANKSISGELCGNGKTVEVYVSDKTIDKVVVIAPTLAKLGANPVVSTNGNTTITSITGMTNVKPENLDCNAELAKDDIVLYVKDANNVWHIEKLEPAFTGKVSSNHTTRGARIDGVYYQATGLTANATITVYAANSIDDDNEYEFYLDASGAIVYANAVTEEAAASNYAVVLQTSWVPGKAASGVIGETGTKGYLQAEILKTDGTTEVVTVASVDGATPVAAGTALTTLGHTAGKYAKTDATLSNVKGSDGKIVTSGAAAIAAPDPSGANDAAKAGTVTVANQFTAVADTNNGDVKALYLGVTNTAGTESGKVVDDDFCTYKVNSKGGYELTTLTAATGDAYATLASHSIENGKTLFDGTNIGNASTVFLYAITTGDDVEYKVYTGIANAPSVVYDGTTPANNKLTNAGGTKAVVTKGGIAKLVYIATTGTASTATGDVIYILSANKDTLNTDPVTYVYDAVVNGEVTTITTEVSNATVGFKTGSANDEGVYTTLSSVGHIGIKSNSDELLITNGANGSTATPYGYEEGTPAFIISEDTCVPTTVEALTADATDLVYVVETSGKVTAVYVATKDSKPASLTIALTTAGTGGAVSDGGDVYYNPVLTAEKGVTTVTVTAGATAGMSYSVNVVGNGTGASAVTATSASVGAAAAAGPYATTATDTQITITVTATDSCNDVVDTYEYTIAVNAAA